MRARTRGLTERLLGRHDGWMGLLRALVSVCLAEALFLGCGGGAEFSISAVADGGGGVEGPSGERSPAGTGTGSKGDGSSDGRPDSGGEPDIDSGVVSPLPDAGDGAAPSSDASSPDASPPSIFLMPASLTEYGSCWKSPPMSECTAVPTTAPPIYEALCADGPAPVARLRVPPNSCIRVSARMDLLQAHQATCGEQCPSTTYLCSSLKNTTAKNMYVHIHGPCSTEPHEAVDVFARWYEGDCPPSNVCPANLPGSF